MHSRLQGLLHVVCQRPLCYGGKNVAGVDQEQYGRQNPAQRYFFTQTDFPADTHFYFAPFSKCKLKSIKAR